MTPMSPESRARATMSRKRGDVTPMSIESWARATMSRRREEVTPMSREHQIVSPRSRTLRILADVSRVPARLTGDDVPRTRNEEVNALLFLDGEDLLLPPGGADASLSSPSSSSFNSRASDVERDDEATPVEVEQVRTTKKRRKARPDPPGSSLSDAESPELLAEIDGKAKDDMLDLTEIDATLELIELLQQPEAPALKDEVEELQRWQAPIYDARNVFADLVP